VEAPSQRSSATAKPGGDAPVRAVDRLVEQLRRYPARPSQAALQNGLFLVDAEGGDPTLIASEPHPRLTIRSSPCRSHDGEQIVFDARTGGPANPIIRLKGLDLVEGRPEIKDLGPGLCPDFSPSDDRVIFLINPGGAIGAAGGVWLMRAAGSDRRLLGSS